MIKKVFSRKILLSVSDRVHAWISSTNVFLPVIQFFAKSRKFSPTNVSRYIYIRYFQYTNLVTKMIVL